MLFVSLFFFLEPSLTLVEFSPSRQINRGLAFNNADRNKLALHGLLPYKVETLEMQVNRSLLQLRSHTDPIAKNIFLHALKNRNETVFYALTLQHFEEIAPLVYTPTVGVSLKFFIFFIFIYFDLVCSLFDIAPFSHNSRLLASIFRQCFETIRVVCF